MAVFLCAFIDHLLAVTYCFSFHRFVLNHGRTQQSPPIRPAFATATKMINLTRINIGFVETNATAVVQVPQSSPKPTNSSNFQE